MAEQDWDLLSSYAGITALATFSVYAGSYGSLKSARKPKTEKHDILQEDDDDDDDDEDLPERLSSSDAYLFPVFGSCALLGLYLVVKFLGTEWINYLLGWYFTIGGIGSVWKSSISIAKFGFGLKRWKSYDRIKVLVLKGPWGKLFEVTTPSLILLPFSLLPSAAYALLPGPKKSAFLTDILALSFSHTTLSVVKLDSFKTGCILLAGLFVYDIWWVFGTEVMVKVATSLDVPIKILWPKSMSFATERGFTMLGLGDIVIPGMFVSLALRYDLSRTAHKDPKEPFASPYFASAISAYLLGLGSTITVMHTFGAAQPALLYLSPACILSFLVTGLVRGDLKKAWDWTDEPEPSKNEAVEDSKPLLPKDDKEPIATKESENPALKESTSPDAEAEGTADDDDEEGNSEPGPKKNRRRGKKKRT